MRSETYMSKIRPNLQRGKLTVENRKSREKKTDMLRSIGKQSGESVESVSFASFIIIFIIEDIFRVAYAVKNYCKDHCSGEEIMTRKKKCHSTSNSFVAAGNKYVFSLFLNTDSDEADVTTATLCDFFGKIGTIRSQAFYK